MKTKLFVILSFFLGAVNAHSQNDLSKMLNLDNASKVASPEKESKVELAVFANTPFFSFSETDNRSTSFLHNGAKTGFGTEILVRAYHKPASAASLLIGGSYMQNSYEFKWFPNYSGSFYVLKGNYSQTSALLLSDWRYKLSAASKNKFYVNSGISLSFLNVTGDYKTVLDVLDLGSTNFNVGYILGLGLTLEQVDLGFRLHATSYDFSEDHKVSAWQCQFRVGLHF